MSETGDGYERVTEFEEFITPLDVLITMVYQSELSRHIPEHFEKYGNECLTNNNSIIEINNLLKIYLIKVLNLISKEYRHRINKIFSKDGIIYYIHTHLHNQFINDIQKRFK